MKQLLVVLVLAALALIMLLSVSAESSGAFQSPLPPPPPCECDYLDTPQCVGALRCIKWWCSPCGEGGFYWSEWVTLPFVSPLQMPPHYHIYLPFLYTSS